MTAPTDALRALLERAFEVVHHDIDCPAIGGKGDDDCQCDAVPFLRDLETALATPAGSASGEDGMCYCQEGVTCPACEIDDGGPYNGIDWQATCETLQAEVARLNAECQQHMRQAMQNGAAAQAAKAEAARLREDAARYQAKYEYALLLIGLSQRDGDGMTGVAFSAQVPIARLDDDWSELVRLMADNAVDQQGWRPTDAAIQGSANGQG